MCNRILAIDLGTNLIGIAICDESRTAVRSVTTLERTSWKRFAVDIQRLCGELDAHEVVLGLPLNLDGTSGTAAEDAQRIRRNLQLTLRLPVHLQDERLTSRVAVDELRAEGSSPQEIARSVHARSAEIILRDYLARVEGSAKDVAGDHAEVDTNPLLVEANSYA